jgi:putative FmdB family regulatory protein
MPFYEFMCRECGSRETVFKRSVTAEVEAPVCPKCTAGASAMQRVVTKFAQHKTEADKLADAEARWGKEVDAAMGPEPDVGRMARRYDSLAKDLPNPENLA